MESTESLISALLLNSCHKKTRKFSGLKSYYISILSCYIACATQKILHVFAGANLFALGKRYFIWNGFHKATEVAPTDLGCRQGPR